MESVDEYIEKHTKYSNALALLRRILLSTELEETIKWNAPVYTINNKNVIGLSAFKNHFGIWFFNGVFLKDSKNLLLNAQEGKTKALRQMRFERIEDIDKNTVSAYVLEAIENQKLGKELKPIKKSDTIDIPELLKKELNKNTDLKLKFNALTPYKKREYAEYINTAKKENTKKNRLNKIIPFILLGVGLNDKYKNC